jgi:hypothetical protein
MPYAYSLTVAVTAVLNTTPPIPYDSANSGLVHIPHGSTITSLTWYSSANGIDFAQVGTAQTVAADGGYQIPTALQAATILKAVGNAAGNILLTLKA